MKKGDKVTHKHVRSIHLFEIKLIKGDFAYVQHDRTLKHYKVLLKSLRK